MKIYTTTQEIIDSINLSKTFTERALIALYNLQTEDEKFAQCTGVKNSQGFNAFDAEILSSFSEQLLGEGEYTYEGKTYIRNTPRHLSDKQLAIARKKLVKYAGQLLQLAQSRTAIHTATDEEILVHVSPNVVYPTPEIPYLTPAPVAGPGNLDDWFQDAPDSVTNLALTRRQFRP